MIKNKIKIIKLIQSKVLLVAMAAWVFTFLMLLVENGQLRDLIFIPIGGAALTLVYFKMYAIIKKIEMMP
jgi:hypothetical protein